MTPTPPQTAIGQSPAVHLGSPGPNRDSTNRNLFEELIQHTNADQVSSNQVVEDLVAGKAVSVQQVVMAVAKAEMSFQLFMEIRNKLIDSYNELMRMQF